MKTFALLLIRVANPGATLIAIEHGSPSSAYAAADELIRVQSHRVTSRRTGTEGGFAQSQSHDDSAFKELIQRTGAIFNSTAERMHKTLGVKSQRRYLKSDHLPKACGSCGIIWFYHIPKCGGNAVDSWFRHLFVSRYIDTIVNLYSKEPIDFDAIFSREIEPFLQNPSGRIIAVHHHHHGPGLSSGTAPPWESIQGRLQAQNCTLTRFTVLRDPVERLISLLQFVGSIDSQLKSEWGKVLQQSRGGEVDNGMIRYILYNQRSAYPKDHPLDRPVTNSTLEEAIGILSEFEVVGKLKTIESDLTNVLKLAGLPTTLASEFGSLDNRALNQSPPMTDPEVMDLMPLIEARVTMDKALYGHF